MSVARNIKLLAWHNFFTDFKLYAPVAILYFAQVSGSYALGMSVFSLAMLTQAVLEIPTGVFSDLIGRKRTVICGSAAITLGTISYAIGGNYGWLMVGACLEGISRAFYSGNNDALLHDTVTEIGQSETYAEKLGKLSSLFQVAAAGAAILGSVIANWSFTWVMWLSVLPQAACLVISLNLIEPQRRNEETSQPYRHIREAVKLFFKNSRLRSLSLANMLGASAGEAIFQFNATFIATLWPIWAIGVAKSLSNAGAAISFYTAGRMIKRFKALPIMIGARIYGRVVSLIAYGLPTIISPILLASHSLLFGTITVADSQLKQKEYTQKQRATMASLDSLLVSLAVAVMTVLIGWLADLTSPARALIYMQGFQLIPILIYWRLWRKR
ncbi:hypothetical protein A2W24_01455 [Microgenomates group bacterium RBG_16_45_19]|nr:MAG: hypothetical protein A2W24_01455 [Microgenomates group bacterium RBG_16_45_19]